MGWWKTSWVVEAVELRADNPPEDWQRTHVDMQLDLAVVLWDTKKLTED